MLSIHSDMIPDPAVLHPSLATDSGWQLVSTLSSISDEKAKETMLLLHALSQTCRSLRAFALPLLWNRNFWIKVQVESVRELGKLRDALRLMPHLAANVREFTFMWEINGDYPWELKLMTQVGTYDDYPSEHGTLLDMAFVDRGALWDRMRKEHGAEMQRSLRYSWFKHNGVSYNQPGKPPPSQGGTGPSINIQRSGPDGNGEDPRIKSVEDFNNCVTEIVAQLSELRALRWKTHVTPIPFSAFEALKSAQSLEELTTNLWFAREYKHCEFDLFVSGLQGRRPTDPACLDKQCPCGSWRLSWRSSHSPGYATTSWKTATNDEMSAMKRRR